MSLQQYSQEELREMSFVELASLILSEKREALSFQQLVDEVAALIGLSEQEVKQRLAQYYTDLNIDGRFICVGENVWGLRTWYPFDQTEDETVMVTKPKKKKRLMMSMMITMIFLMKKISITMISTNMTRTILIWMKMSFLRTTNLISTMMSSLTMKFLTTMSSA